MDTSPQAPVTAPPGREGEVPARFLVTVDERPQCGRLLQAAARMAREAGATWSAVHIDTSRRFLWAPSEEAQLAENLRLAERLGADVIQLPSSGRGAAHDVLALARNRRASLLLMDRADRSRWLARLRKSLPEVPGGPDLEARRFPPGPDPAPLSPGDQGLDLHRLGIAALSVALATGAGFIAYDYLDLADVVMLYMLGIIVMATKFGRVTALTASALSVLALDFCFIQPRFTFVLTDIKHVGTFGVMLGVGWIVTNLTERIKAQARLAQERERHTRALYRLGAVLAAPGTVETLGERVEAYLGQELEMPGLVLLCDARGRLLPRNEGAFRLEGPEAALAQETLDRGTGIGTRCVFLAMGGSEHPVGVLAVLAGSPDPLGPERMDLLQALAAQIALALERARLAEERTEARIRAEHEQLRSTLLSSVSHDLRTPLGTITGATTTLLDPGPEAAPGDQRALLLNIHQESFRLLRLVNNLLDITKLESGQVQVHKEWVPLEEVVGAALGRLEDQLEDRPLDLDLPDVWVPLDPVLFEQVLHNVLENALKFSPPASPIAIRGWVEEGSLGIQVSDRGPGVAEAEGERIFEKLYRGSHAHKVSGAGLGLAICQGIVKAHGGTISADNGPEGGARILVRLPLEGTPPDLRDDPS